MPTHQKVLITIDGDHHQVSPGATLGAHLFALRVLEEGDQLLLEVPHEIDVPVSAADLIFVRGGEVFSIGSADAGIPDNPVRREPIPYRLNDKLTTEQRGKHSHAKVTGAEIKQQAGSLDLDLWVDLDGIADTPIDDEDRIILQSNETFFTVEHEHNEERFYEVTTVYHGDSRLMRLPAQMKVAEATKRVLPKELRPFAEHFHMIDEALGDQTLTAGASLRDAGVKDGHVLLVSKKNPSLHYIIVGGTPHEFHGETITYEEAVRLEFPDATFDVIYTVSYSTCHGHEGTLAPGQNTKVEDGMVIHVRKTHRS